MGPINKAEVKGLCNSFVKPQWLKGSPSKACSDFIEHHKIMETFHRNMDSGKKHVCVSAKTLLWVTNNKKCSKYFSRARLGAYIRLLEIASSCIERDIERQIKSVFKNDLRQ